MKDCFSVFDAYRKRIDRKQMLAFISAVLFGLFVHLYMFTNKLPNHDDIICLFYNDATVTSGRWFLACLIGISSNFSLPWLNGILSLCYLGVLSAMFVRFYGVKNDLSAVLCSFSLVSFPTVTNAFGFMFTSDGYMAGFLLAGIAAVLADRKGKRLPLLSAILLTLAIATYQATLCLFVAILTVRGLLYLIDGQENDKELIRKLLRYVCIAVVSVILYILSAKAALAVTSLEMESYAGLENMGAISLAAIPGMFIDAWFGFFVFAFKTSGIECGLLLSILDLILGIAVTALLLLLYVKRRPDSVFKRCLYFVIILLLPLLLNSASFLGSTHIHAIMMYGIALLFWLSVLLCERSEQYLGGSKVSAVLSWIVLPTVFLVCFLWSTYANQCYLKLQLKYENSYALVNRVIDRIESSELMKDSSSVVFIGEPELGNYPQAKEGYLGSMGSDEGFGGPGEFSFIYDDRHVKDFAKWYLGVKYEYAEDRELQDLQKDERVIAMPSYPAQNSLALIDDMLVVKLGEIR